MYPSWLIVEYASTFLMSFWEIAINAATSAVAVPTTATIAPETGAISKRTADRAIMNTPAVTIVAA